MFIPFFVAGHEDPLAPSVDFSMELHPSLGDLEKEDLRLGYRFLYQYRGSKDTFNSYRRELEKLFQWHSRYRSLIPLRRLRAEDVEYFFEFCTKPPADWIATKVCQRLLKNKPNPHWRPFSNTRGTDRGTQKSLTVLFAVASSFFDFLTNEGISEYNPVSNIRQKSKFFVNFVRDPVRRLSNLQIEYLFKAAEQIAIEDKNRGERDIWIITLLRYCYLRISELVKRDKTQPYMSNFSRDEYGVWWLSIIGKGRKERLIPISDEVEQGLIRYRLHLGLSKYPSRTDTTPLVHDLRFTDRLAPLSSSRQVREVVTALFARAHEMMRADGLEYEAQELPQATVHWLRHTGISEDVKHRPRDHVKEDAGHASLVTTEKYIDIEMRERALSRKKASNG